MERACPDDTADQAAGPRTCWSPSCPWDRCILGVDDGLPHVPTLGASCSSKGDPIQPPPSDGQEEEEDQPALPPSPALPGMAARTLLLWHTILMQRMVPLEIVIRPIWIFRAPFSP